MRARFKINRKVSGIIRGRDLVAVEVVSLYTVHHLRQLDAGRQALLFKSRDNDVARHLDSRSTRGAPMTGDSFKAT